MSLANRTAFASSAVCFASLLSNAIAAQPERSRYGGTYFGTYAYDAQVGYDYGQHDDTGYPPAYYSDNFGPRPRMPGKRSAPGGRDNFDAYYDGYLVNDRSTIAKLSSSDTIPSYRGRERPSYWRVKRFISLQYDDFGEYQRLKYDLGSKP